MGRRYTRAQLLPPVSRDRAAERRADRIAKGERPGGNARAATQAAPAVLGLGAGQPLPATEQRYFERRLGTDLAGVRVHPEAAGAGPLRANAFAAGRDIGFAPGRWRPGTDEGRRLLGHELAHVLEQGHGGGAVQLDDAAKPAEAAQASDALSEGVKTVVEQAKENEGIKKFLLDPAKRHALGQWNALDTGEKVGVGAFGVGSHGLLLGAGLSDPNGRKMLSDVNLAAPLGLIPYATLTDFRYILPPPGGGPTQLKASFSGDDLLGLAHEKLSWMPAMRLSLDFTWSLAPGGAVGLSAAKATWGVMPGVVVQAGSGVGLDWKPTVGGADGQNATVMKSVPALPGSGPGPAGVGVIVSVDLLTAPFVPAAVRNALGAAPEKK
ncbi:MAG TPA: DUF4157 domain-containing protein [Accumulibacter sp.]|nr:DUF4157 domain-containing protein [Accumulibacter sp.]HQC80547.1 DUF4157 domain-containing protein [Accumulibacter sp.]